MIFQYDFGQSRRGPTASGQMRVELFETGRIHGTRRVRAEPLPNMGMLYECFYIHGSRQRRCVIVSRLHGISHDTDNHPFYGQRLLAQIDLDRRKLGIVGQ